MAVESEVVFIRGNKSSIANVEKIDGQLLIETDDNSGTTDANIIYMDADHNGTVDRFAIGGTPQSLIDQINAMALVVSSFNSRVTATEDFIRDNEILVATPST